MKQTGHRSMEIVLRYMRRANAFTDNALIVLGLWKSLRRLTAADRRTGNIKA